MPLKEIRRKFTASELFILAWRSQEQSVQFKRKFRGQANASQSVDEENPLEQPGRSPSKNATAPPGVPARFLNADGEVDLRKMTGPQAWRYFSGQGMKFPIVHSDH
jgi:hypothetical protein